MLSGTVSAVIVSVVMISAGSACSTPIGLPDFSGKESVITFGGFSNGNAIVNPTF